MSSIKVFVTQDGRTAEHDWLYNPICYSYRSKLKRTSKQGTWQAYYAVQVCGRQMDGVLVSQRPASEVSIRRRQRHAGVDQLVFIVMIIAFKGAIQILDNLLTAQRTVSSTYAQVARAQSCANPVQHIERLSRTTCRVTWYEGAAQLLCLTEFTSRLF